MAKRTNQRRKASPLIASQPSRRVEFELNPFYERLLEMREKKPAAYNTLSAGSRLAVVAYLKARAAALKTSVEIAA